MSQAQPERDALYGKIVDLEISGMYFVNDVRREVTYICVMCTYACFCQITLLIMLDVYVYYQQPAAELLRTFQ